MVRLYTPGYIKQECFCKAGTGQSNLLNIVELEEARGTVDEGGRGVEGVVRPENGGSRISAETRTMYIIGGILKRL